MSPLKEVCTRQCTFNFNEYLSFVNSVSFLFTIPTTCMDFMLPQLWSQLREQILPNLFSQVCIVHSLSKVEIILGRCIGHILNEISLVVAMCL